MMKYLVTLALILFPASLYSQCLVRQSTSTVIELGPFVDSTDGNTEKTALTINNTDIRIKKVNAAWANKNSGGATHEEHGWYVATFDTTDTNTVGLMLIAVHVTGALPVWVNCFVQSANEWDSNTGVSTKQVNLTQWNSSGVATPDTAGYPKVTLKTGTGTGEVLLTLGQVSAALTATLQKNVAGQRLPIWFIANNGNGVTGLTSAQITCKISKDFGAGATTNDTTEAEVDATNFPGLYFIDLTQAETNANDIEFTCTSTGPGSALPYRVSITPQK